MLKRIPQTTLAKYYPRDAHRAQMAAAAGASAKETTALWVSWPQLSYHHCQYPVQISPWLSAVSHLSALLSLVLKYVNQKGLCQDWYVCMKMVWAYRICWCIISVHITWTHCSISLFFGPVLFLCYISCGVGHCICIVKIYNLLDDRKMKHFKNRSKC